LSGRAAAEVFFPAKPYMAKWIVIRCGIYQKTGSSGRLTLLKAKAAEK
jgi:hypothetical protein